MPRLSIIIKAYNEQENIARAIASALQAVAPYQGEVILADGASTDRTVEIASRYPITIVVLRQPERRCCGVGPQLGFPYTHGEYVYILDGDMELDASFVAKAIAYLDNNPDVAGVGGAVLETRAPNSEFRSRINRLNRLSDKEADMFCLNGGGLYRRAALLDVGYMSDQNLHGSEEYDLGARLRCKGWRIVRLPDHAADHFAHQLKTLPLLWRRVRNGQLLSLGEVVRASLEAEYFTKLLGEMRVLQIALVVWIYWLLAALLMTANHSWTLAAGLFLLGPALAIAAISYRHRALDLGCLSFVGWHLAVGGLLLGLWRRRVPPMQSIDCTVTSPAVPPGETAAPGEKARSLAPKSLTQSDR
jgi:GT2 family glycosyltransferase